MSKYFVSIFSPESDGGGVWEHWVDGFDIDSADSDMLYWDIWSGWYIDLFYIKSLHDKYNYNELRVWFQPYDDNWHIMDCSFAVTSYR